MLTVVTNGLQMGSAMTDGRTAYRLSSFFMPYAQTWMRGFAVLAGADPNAIKPYTSYDSSEVAELLTTPGDAKFNAELHRRGLLSGDDKFVCPAAAGGGGGDTQFIEEALEDGSDDEGLESSFLGLFN